MNKKITQLKNYLSNSSIITILSGAGLSTASGLPDFRTDDQGFWIKNKPVHYSEFVQSKSARIKSWQNNLEKTLKAGNIFGSEGLAINMSVYIDNLETEFLPLNCNWITSNLLPKYDENNNTFVEPYLPNYKIGIIHLAAGIWKDGRDMRVDKSIQIEIKTLSGKKILKSLRYKN